MDKVNPTLSELGIRDGLSDDDLVALAARELGMDEEDARLMLAIERGEVAGDVIETKTPDA
jgi:hypothetical protein